MAVNTVPDGYHSVTPYLLVRGVPAFIDFLTNAFDATETDRSTIDGTVMHAEVQIGDSRVMIGEATPMPASIYLYVGDADATYRRALNAGATTLQEPIDTPYGDRRAGVTDLFGNQWWIATRVREVEHS